MAGTFRNFSFCADDALKYGIAEAVLLYHIAFWLRKNAANGQNIYGGRVWTYSTVQGFAEYFRFLTPKQVRRAVDRLEERGALVSQVLSENRFNRTKFYTLGTDYLIQHDDLKRELSDLMRRIPAFAHSGNSNSPNGQSSFAHSGTSDLPKRATDLKESDIRTDEVQMNEGKNNVDVWGVSSFQPTMEMCVAFFEHLGKSKKDGEAFFNHYEAQGWTRNNGQPVVKWQAAARLWDPTKYPTSIQKKGTGKGAATFNEDDY